MQNINLSEKDKESASLLAEHHERGEDGQKRSKKRFLIGGSIIAIIAIVAVIALVLANKDDDSSSTVYNPYKVDQSTLQNSSNGINGVLKYSASSDKQSNLIKQILRSQNKVSVLKHTEIDKIPKGVNNEVIKEVYFEFVQTDFKTAHLYMTDHNNSKRYSPPEEFVSKGPAPDKNMRLDMCGFNLNLDPFSFSFSSTRKPGSTLLTTQKSSFLMLDKFTQLDIQLPSTRVYGLGERSTNFTLQEGTWTMWAKNDGSGFDDGSGALQSDGVHPFALIQSEDAGEYFGIYFRNTNAQSPVLQYQNGGTSTLSYITTGGSIEIYFFFKGTAKEIISQYQRVIGRPSLPPFWALGWHSASGGYKDIASVKASVAGYSAANIPLDGVWLDSQYMDSNQDFTVDGKAFAGLAAYATELQSGHHHLMLNLNAGIFADSTDNTYYRQARDNGGLIQSALYKKSIYLGALVSSVWPGHTSAFLDVFGANGTAVWELGINDLFKQVPFDGLQLDQNSLTTARDGECSANCTISEKSANFLESSGLTDESDPTWYHSDPDQDDQSTYHLPFIVGKANYDHDTLSLNATHPSNGLSQYDLHSLYGHAQTMKTSQILDKTILKNKRKLILSRSTFAGTGAYGQHWFDANLSWENMTMSVSRVMNLNMFGIPFVGPDVCGYYWNTTAADKQDELCARWIQLATFYPFARSNSAGAPQSKEPWELAEGTHKTRAIKAINQRYQYLRQFYTCQFEASDQGATCFDPLLFHFPNDSTVFQPNSTESTFIAANTFLVAPVLAADIDNFTVYFPVDSGSWVSMNNYSTIITPDKAGWTTLSAGDDYIHTYLKPGRIAYIQNTAEKSVSSTFDLSTIPLTVVVNRDNNGHAEGTIFLDDGVTQIDATRQYEYYNLVLSANNIKKWNLNDGNKVSFGPKVDKIVIANWNSTQTNDFACATFADGTKMNLIGAFDNDTKSFSFALESGDIDMYTLQDIFFGDSAENPNLCALADGSNDQYYSIKDKEVNLAGNTVSVRLVNNKVGGAFKDLNLTISILASSVINVQWTYADADKKQQPYQVPLDIINPDKSNLAYDQLAKYVQLANGIDGAVSLKITNSNGVLVYQLNGMLLTDYFNYMSGTAITAATSGGVMGLFERVSNNLYLPDGTYSLWSRDTANPVEDGKPPGKNLYGTHPFYMYTATDNSWVGSFTNLAHAQDWKVKNLQKQDDQAATGNVQLQTYAVGGMADLYFMLGATPNQIVQLYQSVVGKPVLTPQWALGWNQCRWGYSSTDVLKEVVSNYSRYALPLDTVWSDIDYLDQYRDFTFDPVNFKDLGAFVDQLHLNGTHYIPIMDAGIAQRVDGSYNAYKDGAEQDVFIKAYNNESFTGQVWPVDAVYPDFTVAKGQQWWKKWLTTFHDQVKFDGLWEDMNEASNFCKGACYASQQSPNPVKYKLPYTPTGRDLEEKGISLDATHQDGSTQLDTHSLFGTQEAKATNEWFEQDMKKRAMIIQRSAYAGLGKFASRWLGDNFATAAYMGYSVTGIMSHNIIGIPLAGADICGFIGDTTPELCARWHTLGAFYPFSRNHNSWDTKAQEPWVFENDRYEETISYLDIMRQAIKTKYTLVRYYYTQLSTLSSVGGAFFKPLFFEFPSDPSAYLDQNKNIMLGEALKLSILSDALDTNSSSFYFPAGTWCDVYKADSTQSCQTYIAGKTVTLSTKAYEFGLHLREGHIIPIQDSTAAMKTKDLQSMAVDFLVNPSCDALDICEARGTYLNDDGEVLNFTGQRNVYNLVFTYMGDYGSKSMTINIQHTEVATQKANFIVNNNDYLGKISLMNAKAQDWDSAKGYAVTATFSNSTASIDVGQATYDKDYDRLVFENKQINIDLPSLQYLNFYPIV